MTQYYTLEELIYNWFEEKLGEISTLPGADMIAVGLSNHKDINFMVRLSNFITTIRSKTKQLSVNEWNDLVNSIDVELKARVPGIMKVEIGGTAVTRLGTPPQWEYAIQIDVTYRKGTSWELLQN